MAHWWEAFLASRGVLLYAAFVLPAQLLLAPLSGVAWNAGGEEEPGDPWPGVRLAMRLYAALGESAPPSGVWGFLHALAMLPVLLTVLAVRLRGFPEGPGRRAVTTAAWAVGVGTMAMLPAYAFGVGWPLDLVSFLFACGATVALGIVVLRARVAPRWVGILLAAGTPVAFGLSLWWTMGYVPAFVALALGLVWGTLGAALWETTKPSRASTGTQAPGPLHGE